MSERPRGLRRYLLGALLGVLTVAVAIQSYLLIQMNARLSASGDGGAPAALAHAEPSPPADDGAAAAPSPSPDPGIAAPQMRPLLPDDWLSEPFDSRTWNPFEEMARMREQMDRMFGRTLGRFDRSPLFDDLPRVSRFSPDVDVREEPDRFVIQVDLPGADEAQIDVHLEGQTLTLSGVRDTRVEERDDRGAMYRIERRSGRFTRAIGLPAPVDEGSLDTRMDNGVLTITVNKLPPHG